MHYATTYLNIISQQSSILEDASYNPTKYLHDDNDVDFHVMLKEHNLQSMTKGQVVSNGIIAIHPISYHWYHIMFFQGILSLYQMQKLVIYVITLVLMIILIPTFLVLISSMLVWIF